MIGRWSKTEDEEEFVERPKGFDDFDLRLGDVMRGERATMGKSLLDVQRELRIKASYIAAIENCDPDAFETPGFIAGYVRSYARYLNMDPDATFTQFCAESGFTTAHGMAQEASSKRAETIAKAAPRERDPFKDPSTPFSPHPDSLLSRVEPGAIGSITVLVALISALGYGGWAVLQEIQRVQVTPVEQTPIVLSELDPLQSALEPRTDDPAQMAAAEVEGRGSARPNGAGVFTPPQADGLDRLYRPQALDVPVLIARDAPISTLDPSQYGSFAGLDTATTATPPSAAETNATTPSTLAGDGINVVAVRPAWVRIRDGADRVLFTGILNAGDAFAVPADALAPRIEVGESGSIYYTVAGKTLGPTGPRGTVTTDLPLEREALMAALPEADMQSDSELTRVMADLGATLPQANPVPQVLENNDKSVTVVASRTAWVRVRSAQGAVLFEAVMEAGDFYRVPPTEEAPTIRTGDAGAIYFAAAGQTYGPYGGNGAVADNLALSVDAISTEMAVADITGNQPLARAVAELNAVPLDQ